MRIEKKYLYLCIHNYKTQLTAIKMEITILKTKEGLNLKFLSRDEAIIYGASLSVPHTISTDNVMGHNYVVDSLRCDNVDGELVLFTEEDREVARATFNPLRFDRREAPEDLNFGYELGWIKINGVGMEKMNISLELKQEIEQQAQNIIDRLNEELHA